MATLFKNYDNLIDFNRQSLALAAGFIIFNPVFWNSVARTEYRTKFLTRLAGGNGRLACYGLGVTIFSLGIFRDFLFERAIREQSTSLLLSTPLFRALSYILLAIGNTLVLSSMWALGFTGTYLGDYFGILKENMVTGFPFNITDAPMYYGSTLSFLGTSIYYGKPAGIILTLEILIVYLIALRFEDPFTMEIYAKRDRERERERKEENRKEI